MDEKKIYFGDWAPTCNAYISPFELMASDFYAENRLEGKVKPEEIRFAFYSVDGYEGSAYVLFERDGKLLAVASSHCSCNGLFWEPALTTWYAEAMSIEKNSRPAYGMDETTWEGFKAVVAQNLPGVPA